MKIYKGLIVSFAICVIPGNLFPQDIRKDIKVIKPYSPTLSDASKINLLPEFGDTLKVNPDFSYSIIPRKYATEFKVNPIKPARMVGLPIPKLYKSQFTFGIGNYFTPLAELTVNELRNKTTAWGIYLRHHSSGGKVKLENDKKVDSDFSDNDLRVSGKKMFYRSVVEGALSGGYNSILHYGYEPSIDTILIEKDIKQKIKTGGVDIRFYSSNPDSSHFNYNAGLDFKVVTDRYKNRENAFVLNTALSTSLKDYFLGGEVRMRYFDFSGESDTSSNFIFDLSPYFSKKTSEWRFLLGFTTSIDRMEKTSFGIYPRAEFEFNIVEDVLVPYFGLTGYREANNYRKIIFENPYIKPGLRLSNTDVSLIGFGGLKGTFNSKIAYNVKASILQSDSMYFYINDSSDTLRNKFTAIFDKTSVMSLNGEVTWHQSNKLQFLLKANYHIYNTEKLEKAWHKPIFELSFGAGYNIKDKILANMNLFYTGKRFAPDALNQVIKLRPYLDANFSVEYRYTKILSFFIRLNNFTASKYQIWNQYPVQRFQLMGGFTYAL